MKLSFSTLACPRWSWNEITATAHDLGYEGIEIRGVGEDISATSIPAFSDSKLPHTLEELKRLNLTIPCLDSDCCIHIPESIKQTQKEIGAYIDLAAKMNVKYVRVMPAAPVPQPMGNVDESLVKEQTLMLAEKAAPKNVTILLETHGIWSKSQKMAKLMSDVNKDNVGVLWDIHHPYTFYSEPMQDTYNTLKPWIKHTHIKDSNKTDNGLFNYTLPGFGSIPITDCVNVLKAGGYDGFFSLEWVKRWDITLEEPGIALAHYINFMRTL